MKKIVVLANYRTGSTALCDIIAKVSKLVNVDEYFHPVAIKSRDLIDDYKDWQTTGYLIKIMPDQIVEPYFSDLINDSTDIIGIYRTDVTAQIASYYIARQRNVWHYKDQTDEPYILQYDVGSLREVADYITGLNKKYIQEFRALCKKEVIYEQVKPLLVCASDYKLYKRPSNYDEIVETINTILQENKT